MWSFYFVLLLCSCVYARTDEEIKNAFTKIVMGCTKDHPVDMTELLQLQSLITPKKMEAKCLLACAYKTEGTMNEKGLYDIEHVYKLAEAEKNGDEKRLENSRKLADLCAEVNDMEVSDKDKGCDRAALIFKCVVEHAPKSGKIVNGVSAIANYNGLVLFFENSWDSRCKDEKLHLEPLPTETS